MHVRYLVAGTLAGALALFAWQTVSNAALPWHEATMREIPNSAEAVRTIQRVAPTNGVWWAKEGVIVATSVTPDLADKTQLMGTMMARQVGIDLVAAFLLALVVLRLPAVPAWRTGALLGAALLAAGAIAHLSNWNWYGFAASYELVNTIDLAINGAIAGLVLGALRGRMVRHGAPGDLAGGVRAEGGLPPLGEASTARRG